MFTQVSLISFFAELYRVLHWIRFIGSKNVKVCVVSISSLSSLFCFKNSILFILDSTMVGAVDKLRPCVSNWIKE